MIANVKPGPRFVSCPGCGQHNFIVEHIIAGSTSAPMSKPIGPWFCDECGLGWRFALTEDGLNVDVTPAMKDGVQERFPEQWVVLERGDLRLLVSGYGTPDDGGRDGTEYYFNEGTCPINYLRDVREVAIVGEHDEVDPHGIFTVVGTIAARDNVCRREQEPKDWYRLGLPPRAGGGPN